MEAKLASNSRSQLERNTKDLIGKLASVLSARANRFNGNFFISSQKSILISPHHFNHLKYCWLIEILSFLFSEFFKSLLAQSKSEFHEMFKRTYGVIYEQNSYVFSDLFSELESYYSRGKVDLSEAMDTFFNVLYQKMFTVLNSQYKFDDK